MAQPPVDPVQKSTFLIARLGHRLLLRLTSTASRGGRDFPSSMRKTLLPSLFDKTSCSLNAIRLIPKNQPSGSSEATPDFDSLLPRLAISKRKAAPIS